MMSTQIKLFLVSFSILIIMFVLNNNIKSTPNFAEAVTYCEDVSNDIWVEEERTYQDKCIDDFMVGRVGSSIFEIFKIMNWRVS